jgi:hypothetical protein
MNNIQLWILMKQTIPYLFMAHSFPLLTWYSHY